MSAQVFQLIASLQTEKNKDLAIKKIQDFVNDSEDFDKLAEPIQDILCEFAYDLDFYVSNLEHRKEDPSYYGDERLNEEIASIIKKLAIFDEGTSKI